MKEFGVDLKVCLKVNKDFEGFGARSECVQLFRIQSVLASNSKWMSNKKDARSDL